MTVRKARSERPKMGARKLPAAPIPCNQYALFFERKEHHWDIPQMTKSILPNASCVRFTASFS